VTAVRDSVWFVPVVCVFAGAALSLGTIAVDRTAGFGLIPRSLTGGPNAAVAILSTVAASMVTLTALVLTITMVVVQLAMGQFSPRIVQRILRDKPSQIAIGLFVATFVHAMLSLPEVQFGSPGRVPGLAIVVSYVLVVVCIVVLVLYVHHIGRALRVSNLIELVGRDVRKLLDRSYPDHGPAPPRPGHQVCADKSGVVVRIDSGALVRVARTAGCTLRLEAAVGDFVPAGGPLVTVEGAPAELRDDDVRRGIELALERSLDQDAAYGFRMLVDIAERSLADSPFQDPTTAVQAIDRLHDGLRQLARRPFPSPEHRDEEGDLRLLVPVMGWDAYVELAFAELRRAGATSPQVSRRLVSALEDLRAVALPERVASLDRQLALLTADVHRAAERDEVDDPAFALTGDRQGIGSPGGSPGDKRYPSSSSTLPALPGPSRRSKASVTRSAG
jgi:uncharacterized membrane protein